jgi:uncharacterized protein (TIGR00369 family)
MSNPLLTLPAEECQRWLIDLIPHSAAIGLRFAGLGAGWAALDLPWREDLVGDPERGLLHGGAITTLMDAACGAATLSALEAICRIATLDLRIDYLRPATTGRTVHCRAECYRLTRQVAFLRATAHDGQAQDPVAHAVGTFMVFRDEVRVAPVQVPGA